MSRYVAWVDGRVCLDTECNAVGKMDSPWDSRAVYCSTKCFMDDGHKHTSMDEDDTHQLLGVLGVVLEPDCCEHCASCSEKVIQGIECDFECDDECVAKATRTRERRRTLYEGETYE